MVIKRTSLIFSIPINTEAVSNMTQATMKHPTYTKGPIEKIGETGGTVVYIFPGGQACVKKGKKNEKTETPPTTGSPKPLPTNNIELESDQSKLNAISHSPKPIHQATDAPKIGDRLVEAGIISPMQLQVALYDQAHMNMRLGDVLIARGWIDQETLESALSA